MPPTMTTSRYATMLAGGAGLLLGVTSCGESANRPRDASRPDDASQQLSDLEFEGLRIEEVAAHRAVFRFTTSRPTSCEAEYGPTPELGLTATDPDMAEGEVAIEHEVPLEDLAADTQYHVRARAEDELGNVYRSQVLEFRTLSAAAATAGQNVALLEMGARVTAVSSNFGGAANDQAWGANRAFDGQMATEWSTAGDGNGAFVEVDLGRTRKLNAFGFRSRKMSDGSSIIRSVRLVLDDARTLGPFTTPDPDEHYRFDFAVASASRVRIEAVDSSGGNTGAKEIELYGE